MDEGPNISNTYLRQLLEQRGWYKRWYTQVMADILLPHVNRLAQPEKNVVLSRYKEDETHMLSLYMVKEFLRTVCLPSTAKIFEAEAGLAGMDQDYHASILEHFSLLKPTTTQEINPPLLSQALHIWKVETGERHLAEASHANQEHHQEIGHEREPSEAQVALNRLLRRESSESTSTTCAALADTVTHSPGRTGSSPWGMRDSRGVSGNASPSFKASDNNGRSVDYNSHYAMGAGQTNDTTVTTQGPGPTHKSCRRKSQMNCRRCN